MATTTDIKGVTVSPVNMENRRSIGIKAGDTVRVHQKIKDDKGKTRFQMFEGLVLARKHGDEPGATFTVRRVIDGIGVEKIFPLYSPMIDKIEIVRRSKVRRAKLYYIREKVAREIRRQMRRMQLTSIATESDVEAATRAEKEAEEAEAKKAEEAAAAEQKASEDTQEEAASESESTDEEKNKDESETETAPAEEKETPEGEQTEDALDEEKEKKE